MNSKIIFWDWNGTLLDDIDACMGSMNSILTKRDMPNVSKEKYRAIFGFPVVDYYKLLGFNFKKESFEELSVEFMEGYSQRIESAKLSHSAIEALGHFNSKGIKQVVISAMEHTMLKSMIHDYGISHFFEEIKGLKDIYAKSKTHLAEEYINVNNINPKEILFIGDTLHDAEVASKIGSDLVLVSNGHHNHEKLVAGGNKVFPNLAELILQLN